MDFIRMPIEIESPEEMGYGNIQYNLAESSVRDRKITDIGVKLDDLILNYGDHRGLLALRQNVICQSDILDTNDVLITQSAAMALFVVNTCLLSKADHIIVIRPNYATNIETPRAIGCEITYIDLDFENAYLFDIEQIKKEIRHNTRLISITNPHNPTAVVFNQKAIVDLAKYVANSGIHVLVDETYRELNFQSEQINYFAEFAENIISICSLSKAYGFPGLRIGWIICKNNRLLDLFLAAKEQIIICNSVIDEYLANEVLKNRVKFLDENKKQLKLNFEIVKNWIENHQYFEWVAPVAGAVCFVRFKAKVSFDFTLFYNMLFQKHGTIVGPGHWFEQPDRYFRLGFGYPTQKELLAGLSKIDLCLMEFL